VESYLADYQQALDELLEMSSSIRHAVLVRGDEQVLSSTFANADSEKFMVMQARSMLEAARSSAQEMGRPSLTQIFIETRGGCVFISLAEKKTWLAATTGTDPTIGLVLYDVNTALRTALEGESAEGTK
jgi:predicted regulator of Ras-like GTPase activity (Roadblock/LC7/MglB family)